MASGALSAEKKLFCARISAVLWKNRAFFRIILQSMKTECICHRTGFHSSALDPKTVSLRLHTAKDIVRVWVAADDPYISGSSPLIPWDGKPQPMELEAELREGLVWKTAVHCPWRRLQYYFRIEDAAGETRIMLENGFYTPEEFAALPAITEPQFFRFPWINGSDVNLPPEWVPSAVWCQIVPDRFRMALPPESKTRKLRPWCDDAEITHSGFYGGDLPGITSRLEYLRDLGFSGIYMTPVFASSSYHRYDTDDYTRIDPDLGTSADMAELVRKAHSLGMRVMLDAVFNHCGRGFFAWRDVVENGERSRYKDWFFVNQWPVEDSWADTRNGRYYSFSFGGGMPKLNTDNPEVRAYLEDLCAAWVSEWDIDGIRFDVGNETSHAFLRGLASKLKKQKPEIFLLGEIWHDAFPWLCGGEYDSVMHYPFISALNEFRGLSSRTQRDLMYAMNRCQTMYRDGLASSLFTFLDTHDTVRAVTRAGSRDALLQELAFLLTMPGTPCVLYGTEIPLEGADDLQGRKCMPWDRIEAGEFSAFSAEVKKLLHVRRDFPALGKGRVLWDPRTADGRAVCYANTTDGNASVCAALNFSGSAVPFAAEGRMLYSRLYDGAAGTLAPGGIVLSLREETRA